MEGVVDVTTYIQGLTQMESIVAQRCEELKAKCVETVEERRRELSHLKKEMQQAMGSAIKEAQGNVVTWEKRKMGELAEVVAGKKWRGDTLELFHYSDSLHDCSLSDLLGLHLHSTSPSPDQTNPLTYPDPQSYISSMSKHSSDHTHLETAYYEAKLTAYTAKETSFLECIKEVNLAEGLEKWLSRGLNEYQSHVKWPLPDSYIRSFTGRLVDYFQTLQAIHKINQSLGITPVSQVEERLEGRPRKRGRPPKHTRSSGRNYDSTKKLSKKTANSGISDSSQGRSDSESPWE